MVQLGIDYTLAPLAEVSLYIHIPFCTSRCRYCSFYFETGWSPRIINTCLDTIIEQSRIYRDALFPGVRPRIRTIYLGGGTPSVIPFATMDKFLGRLRSVWDYDLPGLGTGTVPRGTGTVPRGTGTVPQNPWAPREFAMEANPESLSQDLLEVLAAHGLTRLSVGIQSLQSEALATLGRRAGRADAERVMVLLGHARARGIWQGKINLDLITGIPGQTHATLAEDLAFVLDHGADHVSLYTLTVEPGTSLEQLFALGQARPKDSEEHEALWDQADQALEAAGLCNYEVSNYALPGSESIHNQGYWELRPYAGLGPGATGTLPGRVPRADSQGWGPIRPLRLTGPTLFTYARPGSRGTETNLEVPGPRDFFTDHLLTGLRTAEGIDLGRLRRIFGPGATEAATALAAYWTGRGLAVRADTRLALPREGRLILDPLLADSLTVLDQLGPSWEAGLGLAWPPAGE